MRPILLAIVISLAFTTIRADNEWGESTRKKIELLRTELSNLDADYLVNDLINGTQYVAIVYPTAMKTLYGDHAGHAVNAIVEYTIRGNDYQTITFVSYGSVPIPNYPILVGLCGTESEALYAPDLGYEIPATEKIRERVEQIADLKPASDKRICSE